MPVSHCVFQGLLASALWQGPLSTWCLWRRLADNIWGLARGLTPIASGQLSEVFLVSSCLKELTAFWTLLLPGLFPKLKTVSKSKLRREGVILSHRLSSSTWWDQGRNLGQELQQRPKGRLLPDFLNLFCYRNPGPSAQGWHCLQANLLWAFSQLRLRLSQWP